MGEKTKREVDKINKQESQFLRPLVSIIIPCYNHGNYLSDAIESCLNQTYQAIEIFVVDDGSSDNTKEVASRYAGVNYFFQENQGLSAARNTGIKLSQGEFLVFLDADDLMYEDAISYNVGQMLDEPQLAFVSGAHEKSTGSKIKVNRDVVTSDHYLTLLKWNYIGMIATVMFRRFVFEIFLFDTNLKACEDYDLYLRVAKIYPVKHHEKILTNYRIHKDNMSNNIPLMLSTALNVMERHRGTLFSKKEMLSFEEGKANFKAVYIKLLYKELKASTNPPGDLLNFLKSYNSKLYYKIVIKQYMRKFKKNQFLKKLIQPFVKRLLFNLGLYKGFVPPLNNVNFGDLNRPTPFSKNFGYDRGGPIDRYYIEKFLEDNSISIQGRVLEIGDNEYTLHYGKGNVIQSEILHVNDSNPNATIIGDLSDAPHIPDNSFDCIILTQTLHLVYDYKSVIQTCYRVLKPGGSLLLTVPGITPIDYGEWGNTWYWSFTGQAMVKIMVEYFTKNLIHVNTFGNVYVASAFLYGIGLPEIKKEMLAYHDPQMQVIVAVKAQKEKNDEG